MKKYALLAMLLIGLLIPMTIASKSIDFDINTVLFGDAKYVSITVDVLKLVQPLKIKFTNKEELTIQKIRYSQNQTALAVGQGTAVFIFRDSNLAIYDNKTLRMGTVRYQVDSIENDIQKYAITNYIRYL